MNSNALIATLLLAAIFGCGRLKPSGKIAGAANADLAVGELIYMEQEVDYDDDPVELLFIMENSDRINSSVAEFRDYLWRTQAQKPLALKSLAVRLRHADSPIRLGVLQPMHSDAQTSQFGSLRATAGKTVFDNKDGDFVDAAFAGMSFANQLFQPREYKPLTAIAEYLKKRTKTGNPETGMVRDKTRLSIVHIGYFNESGEPRETADLASLLNEAYGANRWIVNTLSPPKEGCTWKRTDNSQPVHTNQDNSAANSTDQGVYLAYNRLNKVLNLAQQSGGAIASICDAKSYSSWVDTIAKSGLRSPYWEITLEHPAAPSTIKVVIDGRDYENWTYRAKDQTIVLRRDDTNQGDSVEISYNIALEDENEDFNPEVKSNVEQIKEIKGRALSPAELAYINDGINTIVQTNCRGCHGANSPSLADFDAVFAARARMGTAIRSGSMPQGNPGFAATTDGQALLNWIDSY